MSKKPSRKQRKEARQKALRALGREAGPDASASEGQGGRKHVQAAVAAPPPNRRARKREAREAARADAETTPISEKKAPTKKKPERTNRQKAERAMLLFVALVAIAGVIVYLATRPPDKSVMVPEAPTRETPRAGTEIPPPIEVRTNKEAPPAPPPTAPPVDSSPPTIVPAASPTPQKTTQAAAPPTTGTKPKSAPKKSAPAPY